MVLCQHLSFKSVLVLPDKETTASFAYEVCCSNIGLRSQVVFFLEETICFSCHSSDKGFVIGKNMKYTLF